MKESPQVNVKVYSRAVVAVMLLTAWILVTLSGFVLWLAPSGLRSGRQLLLFGLTKGQWNDVHFWIAVAAILVTIVHVIIDWKALRGVIRYMVSVHREKQTP